ncbi:MAG: polyprenyl synthetase family protein, partial [Bdellovibrionales bacterium]|nr:polyprenyl synthetase family protein [Bdellovibrionales bacterium]NQZ20017.1 polyprenyl synthetase family protein [Bdellovibrionales bacterium]
MNIKIYNEKDFPAYLPKLNNLYDDLFEGGKGFRSLLTQKVARPLGVSEKAIHLLCQTIEFIHNASLLHDDLVDRSSLRRGKTTAWLKYTPEYAVLAGDYLLARVMTNLSSPGNIELVQVTSRTIAELLEGEWIQDSLVGDFNLTFDQLTEVHSLKTASLFRWCLFSPFVAKEVENEKIRDLVLELGT